MTRHFLSLSPAVLSQFLSKSLGHILGPSTSSTKIGTYRRRPKRNGEGEIRTPATLSGRPVFETGAFNRSATSPEIGVHHIGAGLARQNCHLSDDRASGSIKSSRIEIFAAYSCVSVRGVRDSSSPLNTRSERR